MEPIDDTDDNEHNNTNAVNGDELLAEAAALNDPRDPLEGEPGAGPYGARLGGATYADPSFASGPPPFATPHSTITEDRLTRDPNTTLGGVLSGIAHRYGWDVAITRLVFIVAVFLSGGGAIPIYLLAWLIVPRANMWPPVQRKLSGISGRDIGVGVLFLATLIFLGVGFDNGAPVLVPLLLLGAGVYLLNQNPRTESAAAFAAPAATMPPASAATAPPRPQDAPYAQTHSTYGTHATQGSYGPQPLAPQPVPKRSRGRRGLLIGGVVTVLMIPVVLIGGVIAFFAVGADSIEWTDEEGVSVEMGFTSVDEIPALISEGNENLVVDLADVDFSGVDPVDPVVLDVRMEAGQITVIVPEDVRADIRAESQFFGAVDVLGATDEGISSEVYLDVDEPQLVLDLEVDAGKIIVSSVGSPTQAGFGDPPEPPEPVEPADLDE